MRIKEPRRGAALVLAALFCLALIPMVGLAIDGMTAFMMRVRISTALDASVLAGARSLNVGADPNTQQANAAMIAVNVFNANLSGVNWGLKLSSPYVPQVNQDDVNHYRTVTGSADADLPLTMMGILGFHSIHIHMTAKAQRRDVNVVLVLDHSGSMKQAMPSMITAATEFTNMFAGGRDALGLVVFTGSTFVAYHPSVNFKSDSTSVTSLIGQLTANNGATNTAQAMWDGYSELKTLNKPGQLNVVVLFTDGLANTYSADFSSLIAPASSGCTGLALPLPGVILAYTGGSYISGLSDPTALFANDVTENRAAPNSNGCFWNTNTLANGQSLPTVLSGLPPFDINGNSTNGKGSTGPYLPVDLTQAALATAFSANVNVTNSGQNAFDDAASRIRGDANLTPLIYCIGLGGNPGAPPDNVLMARVANDPSSISFNPKQAPGLYIFSPSTAQLHSAFLRIASQILRLAQ